MSKCSDRSEDVRDVLSLGYAGSVVDEATVLVAECVQQYLRVSPVAVETVPDRGTLGEASGWQWGEAWMGCVRNIITEGALCRGC